MVQALLLGFVPERWAERIFDVPSLEALFERS